MQFSAHKDTGKPVIITGTSGLGQLAPMKFQPEKLDGLRVTHFDGSTLTYVSLDSGQHQTTKSVMLHSDGTHKTWDVNAFEDLSPTHFATLLDLGTRPELVIFGSGTKLRFPNPKLLQALIEAGVGLETMDSAAACRTFNVLASEGRKVVGAFIL